MVEEHEQTQEDFKNEMAAQAREQRDAMAAMDQFDNRMKGSKLLGAGDDSSSDEEASGPRKPASALDIEKTKNQILLDKLYRA